MLAAVELGHIPISAAKVISEAAPGEEQNALQDAYENNLLKGYKLRMAKQLLESRNKHGKELRQGTRPPASPKQMSADDVLEVYQKEVDRKRHITKKAELVTQRMAFIAEALRQLYHDDAFAAILEAQNLTSLPKPLQSYIQDSP